MTSGERLGTKSHSDSDRREHAYLIQTDSGVGSTHALFHLSDGNCSTNTQSLREEEQAITLTAAVSIKTQPVI